MEMQYKVSASKYATAHKHLDYVGLFFFLQL